MEIGQLCVKIAGRDAGCKCIIVDVIDDNFVMIAGETRKRKCNILHLEPLNEKLDIKKNPGDSELSSALKRFNIELRKTKAKGKSEKPKRVRLAKVKKDVKKK